MTTNKSADQHEEVTFPHVGQMLENFFSTLTHNRADLARRLNISASLVSRVVNRKSIQLRLLWDISMVLNHNFIAELGDKLPVRYTSVREKELEDQVTALQKEIEKQNIELAVYKSIVGK